MVALYFFLINWRYFKKSISESIYFEKLILISKPKQSPVNIDKNCFAFVYVNCVDMRNVIASNHEVGKGLEQMRKNKCENCKE